VSSAWTAAFALLVLLTVANTVVVVGVLRQVGVLHQRIRPTGPGTYEGPAPGDQLPTIPMLPVSDADQPLFSRAATLMVYVTPGCSVCRTMPDIVRAYLRHLRNDDDLEIAFVTDVPFQAAVAFALEMGLPAPLYQSDTLSKAYELPGSPYVFAARLLAPDALEVLAAGVVNTLEQFEDVAAHARAQLDLLAHPPVEQLTTS
jgi:hypothetical protein